MFTLLTGTAVTKLVRPAHHRNRCTETTSRNDVETLCTPQTCEPLSTLVAGVLYLACRRVGSTERMDARRNGQPKEAPSSILCAMPSVRPWSRWTCSGGSE
eukprot:7727285-Pyramimonas_sp.AAC.1